MMVDQKKPPNPSIPAVDTKPLTTFVQVDTTTFREVVQRLTAGSSSSDPTTTSTPPSTQPSPPAINNPKGTTNIGVKNRPAFKLHERRQYKGSKLEIIKPPPSSKQQYYRELLLSPPQRSPQQRLVMSPNCSRTTSPLSTPTRCLANLSLLEKEITTPMKGGSTSLSGADLMINAEEEEKAIKERRFYLHPSPRTLAKSGGGSGQPELLNLFPVESPTSKES